MFYYRFQLLSFTEDKKTKLHQRVQKISATWKYFLIIVGLHWAILCCEMHLLSLIHFNNCIESIKFASSYLLSFRCCSSHSTYIWHLCNVKFIYWKFWSHMKSSPDDALSRSHTLRCKVSCFVVLHLKQIKSTVC